MKWLKSWGLPILLIFLIQGAPSRGLLTDTNVPDLQGALAMGGEYRGVVAEKKPVLIYFWGSWCGICRAMEGTIARIAQDHAVLSVALRSGTLEEVRQHMAAHGFNVPTIADPMGQWGERFGVRGVPALFFVDRAGRIQSATTGFTFEPSIRARLWWLERP